MIWNREQIAQSSVTGCDEGRERGQNTRETVKFEMPNTQLEKKRKVKQGSSTALTAGMLTSSLSDCILPNQPNNDNNDN